MHTGFFFFFETGHLSQILSQILFTVAVSNAASFVSDVKETVQLATISIKIRS